MTDTATDLKAKLVGLRRVARELGQNPDTWAPIQDAKRALQELTNTETEEQR